MSLDNATPTPKAPGPPPLGDPSQPTPAAAAIQKTQSNPTPAAPPAPPKEELPASIEDFDTLINGDLKAFSDQSKAMGGLLSEQVS